MVVGFRGLGVFRVLGVQGLRVLGFVDFGNEGLRLAKRHAARLLVEAGCNACKLLFEGFRV